MYQSLLTVCSLEEFTCSDGEQHQHGSNQHGRMQKRERARESKIEIFSGACISMDRRCDQFPNCKDFSDEKSIDLVLGNHFWKSTKVCLGKLTFFQTNCQLVVKGDNYRADSSPFTVDQQERLVKTVVQLKVREAPS